MRRHILTSGYFIRAVVIVGILSLLLVSGAYGSENYAGDFLMHGVGARVLGMGSAVVSTIDDASSIYYNPAGLARISDRELTFMHSEQFAGLINYNSITAAMPLSNNLAMGAALIHSGIGDIKYTDLLDPSQPLDDNNRPIIASREDATDYTMFVGAAKQLSSQFHIGGAVKVIRRSIGPDTAFGYGIDLGAQYILGRYWRIGAMFKDATGTEVAWDGKATDRIAPTLDAGMAMLGTLPLFGGDYMLTGSMVFFGDSPGTKGLKTMNLGGEYLVEDIIAFRAGSRQGDGTFGIGIMRLPLISSSSFDYAFLAHDALGSTHRVSMTIRY